MASAYAADCKHSEFIVKILNSDFCAPFIINFSAFFPVPQRATYLYKHVKSKSL